MRNKYFLLLFTILFFSSAYGARNSATILGKITEKSNGAPLPFATVTIKDLENKIVSGATSGEKGYFEIKNITRGEYKLVVSFIGYKDTTVSLSVKDDAKDLNLGEIVLESNSQTLQSAVVTAKIPVIEQKLDKIVMNVAEAVSTQGSNALEVLRKAPGVSTDINGNILLNGTAVQVWIDNRPSNLTGEDLNTLLSGTDGSTIDKIEIIAHPSSKYDAEGSGGIINIKTKRNFAQGFSGSLKGSYSPSFYSKYYQGADGALNLNYRTEHNSTSVIYSPKYSEEFQKLHSVTDLGQGVILKGITENEAIIDGHSLRVVNDLYISRKDVIGVVASGMINNRRNIPENLVCGNELLMNNSLEEKTDTKMDEKRKFRNFSANLNYTHTFKEGHELTFNSDWGYYNIGSDSFQENIFSNASGEETRTPLIFRSLSDQFINIYSLKADYEQTILKSVKIESGIKWARSSTNNDLLREDKVNGAWIKNNQLSSLFDYNEDITAVYLSLAKQLGTKCSIKGGLRGEFTSSRGEWISSDTTTTKNYFDIFPTLFASYNPNKDLRIGLSYTLRIMRPYYYQLNPFRNYIDAVSLTEGNPDLDPQYNNEISVNLGYRQNFSLAVIAQSINGVIIQNPYFNPQSGEKLLLWENFGRQRLFGMYFAVTELPITKWLTINANTFVSKIYNRSGSFINNSFYSNIYINTGFLLPEDLKIELIGTYQTSLAYGHFKIKPVGELSAGIKKGLMKNKATLSLNISDILRSNKQYFSLADGTLDNYSFDLSNRSQKFTISLSYRFGKGKAYRARKAGTATDESSRIE
jgi:hypothetical protein